MLHNRNRQKSVQAILYFAHHTAALGKVKLFKLLYLLDFEHFRQTGRSVTGMEYRAWKMGPVPAELVQQWDELDADLAAAIRIVPEQVIDFWREKVVPLQPFDGEHFTKRELRLLEIIANQHCNALSEKMIDVTHAENGAWATTWAAGEGNDDVIPYVLALADDDPNRDAILASVAEYQAISAAQAA
ncbi:Panacea domain-containing protein [Thermomonas sp.]|uniref:Panacea domain-containing protein n=1 Tax=Thermomonas sp. TaxID=1971895 RepID=UPI0024876564|nr:Panacea domain-containing protein [Thermomonas sp.]MDI1253195.1 Panacea domain-containing protein [Thermomonas sp.]